MRMAKHAKMLWKLEIFHGLLSFLVIKLSNCFPEQAGSKTANIYLRLTVWENDQMSADNFGGTVYKEANVTWQDENYTEA